MNTAGLPGSLADFGPAALAAVVVAGYLVVGEPAGRARRCTGGSRAGCGPITTPGGPSTVRLLILEWGLSLLAVVVWLSAPGVDAGQVGLRWPAAVARVRSPGWSCCSCCSSSSSRPGRPGVGRCSRPRNRCATRGTGRHAEPAWPTATLALLPRTAGGAAAVHRGRGDGRGLRGVALPRVLPGGGRGGRRGAADRAARGRRRAWRSAWRTPTRGRPAILTTGLLGGVMAALYLQTGSLLLPGPAARAPIDLRFLLVPVAGAARGPGSSHERGPPRRSPVPADRAEIAELRTRVFVEEQGVPPEIEQDDADALGGARAEQGRRRAGGRDRPAAGPRQRRPASAGWPPTRPCVAAATVPPSSPNCTARRCCGA